MNKVIITGAAGLLGQYMVKLLVGSSFNVLGLDIAENPFTGYNNLRYHKCDLTEFKNIKSTMSEYMPNYIINCAGYTNVDGCEKNRGLAYALNSKLVENLLTIDCDMLINYSTDFVFDGQNGPYSEDDPVNPLSYYGETKLISENMMMNSNRKHIIIRTNVLFGNGVNIRPNFISWLAESLNNNKPLTIVTDQYNNPIHAGNLAEASWELIESGFNGVIHLGGGSYLSRYDIAIQTAEHYKLDKNLITAITTDQLGQAANRPLKGGLKIDKAEKILHTRILPFDKALSLE